MMEVLGVAYHSCRNSRYQVRQTECNFLVVSEALAALHSVDDMSCPEVADFTMKTGMIRALVHNAAVPRLDRPTRIMHVHVIQAIPRPGCKPSIQCASSRDQAQRMLVTASSFLFDSHNTLLQSPQNKPGFGAR
jgi:hypothetical protein